MTGRGQDADRVVNALLAAVLSHDPDKVAAFFTDDATCQLIPGSMVQGKEAIRQLFAQMTATTSDIRIEVHRQVASDAFVMNERTDYLSFGDTRMELAICGVFEIEGSLIKSWREYYLEPLLPPS